MRRLLVAALLAGTVAFVWALRGRMAGPPAPRPALSGYDGQVIEHFTLEGFDEAGEPLWSLAGDVARVRPDLNVFIEKNVRLTVRGATVETDRVFWRNTASAFETKMPVHILLELQRVEGMGAHGKLKEEFLQIHQNVRMFLDGPVFVTAWGPMKIFRKERKIVIYRDATIHDSKGTVKAERVDVLYDKDIGKIRELVARGNVRIRRGESESRSQMAIYNTETQSIRLVGEPEVTIDEERVSELGAF
jgi:hypothetical protein